MEEILGNSDQYLHLYPDCIAVKGASRFSICDTTRGTVTTFDACYYPLLEALSSRTLGAILDGLAGSEERNNLIEFIAVIVSYEMVYFACGPAIFDQMKWKWDYPGVIQNAIVDVGHSKHNFRKIFEELDKLGCQFVQIRTFSDLLSIADLEQILLFARDKSIESLEVILKYNPSAVEMDYVRFAENQPMLVSIVVHSSPEDRSVPVYGGEQFGKEVQRAIVFVTEKIGSERHCGLISVSSLSAPSSSNVSEAMLFNGCLNRKVSVDTLGNIKNCPSMLTSYGRIDDVTLGAAVATNGFTDWWLINKDQIDTCKDCEFRYVCSDCRAYVDSPDHRLSKPLKCGYRPLFCYLVGVES